MSFPKFSLFRVSRAVELIHRDLCVLIEPATLSRSKYFLLFVDDFSILMWAKMLKLKSDALETFKKFKLITEVEKLLKIG